MINSMNITVVVAMAANNMIGCANKLLWHIKEDLQHFKKITTGGVVIMGRKTYESIGKPLPNRRNIIISRNGEYTQEGCEVFTSIDSALATLREEKEIFIIGGGEIYRQMLPLCDKIELTVVERDYEGDTLFPEINENDWEVVHKERYDRGEKFEYPFSFETLKRRNNM